MFKTLFAVAVFAAFAVSSAWADTLEVGAGQSRRVDAGRGVAQVVIGDPKVADVSVDGAGRIQLFGKRACSTSLTVLGRNGAVLLEQAVVVRAGGDGTVTVTYGAGKDVKPGGLTVIHACGQGCSRVAEDGSGGASQKP
jgi:Flp pilus assembly secretin CpaC